MDGQQKIQKMNCPLIRIITKKMILRNSGTGIMQYTELEAVQEQIFLQERVCQILPVIRQEGMAILITEIMLEITVSSIHRISRYHRTRKKQNRSP